MIRTTLGAEHNDTLQRRLIRVLRDLGAELSPATTAVAGSQEIVSRTASFGSRALLIECETYAGLTLVGDADLVARVAEAVKLAEGD